MPTFVATRGHLRVLRPVNKAGEDVRLVEGRQRAMELRRDGHSYRQIAASMGISVKTAYEYVQAEMSHLRDMTAEDTEALRELGVQRCDNYLRALGPAVRIGDPAAISAALKVEERRAKLLGLDAPERKEILHAVITPEEAGKLSDAEIFEELKKLVEFSAASLPGAPVIDVEAVKTEYASADMSDAEVERPPAHVAIDVTGLMRVPRQGKYSRVVSMTDFGADDEG